MKKSVFTGLLAAAFLSLCNSSHALVIEGQLLQAHNPQGEILWRTVDFIPFSTAGGLLTFDIFSSGLVENGEFKGIDDPSLWLFRDDGALDAGDLITVADDSVRESDEGPFFSLDPLLELRLANGQYVVAVGSSGDSDGQGILDGIQFEGINSGPVFREDSANYRLTVTGDFRLAGQLPEPSTLALIAAGMLGVVAFGRGFSRGT